MAAHALIDSTLPVLGLRSTCRVAFPSIALTTTIPPAQEVDFIELVGMM